MRDEAVRAFVPGHVTAFFAPHHHAEPARAGSTGAGITLDDGVTISVSRAAGTSIVVNGESISMEPVDRVLTDLELTAHIQAETPLSIGTGFGVSGAIALGTALAGNVLCDGTWSENELISLAHRAEVEAGTGLGDVVAQARGGVPIRLSPGDPLHGRLDGVPRTTRIEYLTYGDVSTPEVLAGDTEPIESAGSAALSRIQAQPSLEVLFGAARTFARDAGLETETVAGVIEEVQANGGEAAMAMLGETVLALGTGLSDAGYSPAVCHVHPGGAMLLDGDSEVE